MISSARPVIAAASFLLLAVCTAALAAIEHRGLATAILALILFAAFLVLAWALGLFRHDGGDEGRSRRVNDRIDATRKRDPLELATDPFLTAALAEITAHEKWREERHRRTRI